MIIREGTIGDAPAIVDLLRKSLGQELMPKTEAFWLWKHVENPFGHSDVLLAYENAELVGVRAFMKWEWSGPQGKLKAVRAVDTATHPKHQGKGIFKSLTLLLVEKCKADGVDFIFNTPNKQSGPGYLKMGWQRVGRVSIAFQALWPTTQTPNFKQQFAWNEQWLSQYSPGLGAKVVTSRTAEYFRWRYGKNPNVPYQLVSGEGFAYVFRLKQHRWGLEFRICDSFMLTGAETRAKKALAIAARQSGAKVITGSNSAASFPVGPLLTWYPLSNRAKDLPLSEWKPSLGDIEVF